jgi:hypothetical protein
MLKQWHWAGQYLATAAISFLEANEDDSHTNLGLDESGRYLSTHPLGTAGKFVLDLAQGSLFLENRAENLLALPGKIHEDIVQSLKHFFQENGLGDYEYDLHYNLPYEQGNAPFLWSDDTAMQAMRVQAHRLLEDCSRELGFCQVPRIWPHHFDSGVFGPSEHHSTLYIGMGLAVPDTLSKQHYYYLSAYHEGQLLSAQHKSKLATGQWVEDEFEGAILRIDKESLPTDEEILNFYRSATQGYIQDFSAD